MKRKGLMTWPVYRRRAIAIVVVCFTLIAAIAFGLPIILKAVVGLR